MSVIQHRYCYREPGADDQMSRLPDEILLIILSHLTTEDAVRTSILSTRWTSLWLYTSRLDFSASSILVKGLDENQDSSRYTSMLRSVLQLHRSPALDELSVRLDHRHLKLKESFITLLNALPKKTKRLDLDVIDFSSAYSRPKSPLPSYSDGFTDWFRVLDRSCLWMSRDFFDRCIDAGFLKELNLKGLWVEDEHIKLFFRKFRCLERLTVVGTEKMPKLVSSSSSLRYLNITYSLTPLRQLKSIKISNFPNLRTLVIENEGQVTLTDVPMLSELHVYGLTIPHRPLSRGIICHLSRLEALMLHSRDLENLIKFGQVPELANLKTLTINIAVWKDESLIELTSLINACPNLHKFVLQLYWAVYSRIKGTAYGRMKRPLKPVHLKVIEVSGYYGHSPEDELIMHILDNAAAVEQLVLDPRNNTSIIYNTPVFTNTKREEKARKLAHQLQKSVPSHVKVIILQ